MRKSLLDFCLESGREELLRQWSERRNGALGPADITRGSRRKVWWRCTHGHEWQATVASRASRGTGCPVCTVKRVCAGENDLASRLPALAAQWDAEKNGDLRPE